MILLEVLKSILPIVLLIVIGYALHQTKQIDDGFNANVSYLVINIALPASIFVSVTNHLTTAQLQELTLPLAVGAVAFTINYGLSFFIMKAVKIPHGRRGIFINTIVNANTIFIGMPLNQALFGEQALKYFLIYYVLNTISTWTIGSILIAEDAEAAGAQKISVGKIMSPPILGFIMAVLCLLAGCQVPSAIHTTLTYLGNLVTPLSLLYIGIVLSKAGLSSIHIDTHTSVALVGKFLVSPTITALVLFVASAHGIRFAPALRNTFIVQASVPALTVLPVLAGQAKGDVEYATNVVTMSTVLFVIVIPIVMMIV